jgi:hypothetical protein
MSDVTNILGDAPKPNSTHDKPVFDRGEYVPETEKATGVKIVSSEIMITGFGRELPAVTVQAGFERGQSDAANGIHQRVLKWSVNPYSSAACFAWLRGYHLGGGEKNNILPLLPRYRKSTRWVSGECADLEIIWGEYFLYGENDKEPHSYFAKGIAQQFVGRNPVPGCYRAGKGKEGAGNNPMWWWKFQREFVPRKSERIKQAPPGQSWDDFMQDNEMYIEVAA